MNSHRHSTPSAPPRCPRCGYDLRGFVDTWSDSCPLTGRCSECGLDFEWGKVFADERHPWLFEQRWRWRHQPIRSALITFWKVVRPWRFWREIEMTDDFAPVPAFAWAGIVLMASTALLMAQNLAISIVRRQTSRTSYSNSIFAGFSFRGLLRRVEDECDRLPAVGYACVWICLYILISGLVFVLLPVSLRRAKVRISHIVRLTFYNIFNAFVAVILLHLFFLAHTNLVSRYSAHYNTYTGVLVVLFPTLIIVTAQYFALRFYLKLPHAFAVSALLTFLAALLTLACFTAWTWAVDGALWLADF